MSGFSFASAIPVFEGFGASVARGVGIYVTTRIAGATLPIFLRTFRSIPGVNALYQRRISSRVSTAGPDHLRRLPPTDQPLFPAEEADLPPEDRFPYLEPDPVEEPASGLEYHFNPLSIIIRAIRLPVFGLIDLAVTRSKAVVYNFVSLFYHAFPLSNVVTFGRFIRMYKRTPQYLGHPKPLKRRDRCEYCGECLVRIERLYVKYDWLDVCFCRQYIEDMYQVESQTRPMGCFRSFDNINLVDDNEDVLAYLRGLFPESAADLESCPHRPSYMNHDESSYQVPTPTPDGLMYQPPTHRWRWADRACGLRCVVHYQDSYHNWHPEVVKLMTVFSMPLSRRGELLMQDLLCVVVSMINWSRDNLNASWHYYLQAITTNRVSYYRHHITQKARVFLIDDPIVRERLVRDHPDLGHPDTLWLVLPVVNNPVSFATWRLLFAMFNPVDCKIHIVNQSFTGYQAISTAVVKHQDVNLSSLEIGNCWPFFMGNALIHGATMRVDANHILSWFLALGGCYGFDELYVMLKYQPTVLVYTALGLPQLMAPVVSPNLAGPVVVNFKLINVAHTRSSIYTCDFTRERIAQMRQLSQAPYSYSNLGFWHGFFDPRPIELVSNKASNIQYLEPDHPLASAVTVQPTNVPGDNILVEASHMTGGIIFYTFGSRGDRNPILAHARRLADYGAKVWVIHLATTAEGLILAGSDPKDELLRVNLFIRARNAVRRMDAPLGLVPFQLLVLGTTTYSLAPPDDVIYPFRASDNAIIALIYSLLGLFIRPNFHIGGYSRPFYLPTSVDGVNFLEYQANIAPQGARAAYWGGDRSVPEGYEDIPVLPDTNHVNEFPKYEVIFTRGTAGAVALGASTGTRIVSVDDRLDRAYRNPNDCGVGCGIGTDPDAMFLALASEQPVYLGIWARRNWYRVDKLFAWYGVSGLAMTSFRLLMLYLLFARYQKPSMISGDPMTSLFLIAFNLTRLNLTSFVAAYAIAHMSEKILVSMGRDYYWVTSKFVDMTFALITSIPALWAAQRSSIAVGYIVALCLRISIPFIDGFMAWVIETLRLYSEPNLAHGTWYYELTVRWHYIPVFHCALVDPSTGNRFEGVRDEHGLYRFEVKPGGNQGFMNFPTWITGDDLQAVPNIFEVYSTTWNCQVGLFRLFPGKLHRMGIGAIPIALHTLGSIALALVGSTSIVAIYAGSMFFPSLLGYRVTRHGQLRILGDMVSNLFDALSTAYAPRALLEWFAGIGVI